MPPIHERHLTLVIPGLFGSPTGAPAPVLERLLARARTLAPAARDLEGLLFELFGAETGSGDLPVAAVTRVLDMGVVDREWWIRADPVHLELRRDELVLTDPRALALTAAEATVLAAELQQHYVADGWLLKAPRPDRWYLKPPRAADIVTTALPAVVGRDIHAHLPSGPDARAWHTLLNELQILLHTARLNAEREQQGRPSVNSLWFWGGGRLPRLGPACFDDTWSDEPLALALARLADGRGHGRPEAFAGWAAQAGPGRHLVVLAPLPAGDPSGWPEALARLERDWFAPLHAAMKDRTLAGLRLYSDSREGFELSRRDLGRWWRRRRDLGHYLLAGGEGGG